ncbi:HutD/Ves family protein [Kocuria nitroreducens]|uniref:HutD/Ves family protein n=1 Tax=Kocuria nitroreducens TaxID=3058914 RepID=UPI0036DCD7D4
MSADHPSGHGADSSSRPRGPSTATVLRFADLRPEPWRNGGGITREIAGSGSRTGNFAWRLSLADVEQPGPFSRFPGTDRILTVTEGEGMLLTMDGHEHAVQRGRPFHFSGDVAATATLPAGAIRALNVIARRDAVRADVVVQELSDHGAHRLAPHSFGVLLSGHAIVRTDVTASELHIHDTVRGTASGTPVITGDGLLAVVSLEHRG